jgi:hypothetical protein
MPSLAIRPNHRMPVVRRRHYADSAGRRCSACLRPRWRTCMLSSDECAVPVGAGRGVRTSRGAPDDRSRAASRRRPTTSAFATGPAMASCSAGLFHAACIVRDPSACRTRARGSVPRSNTILMREISHHRVPLSGNRRLAGRREALAPASRQSRPPASAAASSRSRSSQSPAPGRSVARVRYR